MMSEETRDLETMLKCEMGNNFKLINEVCKLQLDNALLKDKIKHAELIRNLLGACLVLAALCAFFCPVPVRIGDVCLSCWGG